MTRSIVLLLTIASLAVPNLSIAQGRVERPRDTTRPSETSAQQVKQCLRIAREIAELSDAADQAQAAGDIDSFNATVDPYNAAIARWNAGCTRPYNPADMVRAENELGYRLCQYTQSPCLSEAERGEILIEEKRRLEQIEIRGGN